MNIGFPVWLINDTIKLIFMWSILIIFGIFSQKPRNPELDVMLFLEHF